MLNSEKYADLWPCTHIPQRQSCSLQAAVDGAIEVPIYIPETQWSPLNVLKQLSNFGLGGWWLGGSHMIPNQTFMQDVRRQVPQDAKVIVACQKGLR